jgi:hypothetical protein
MDTGEGGCNDNLLYGNDFSHAPTNGIEATFSRNKFVNNLVLECWHGIWGGYGFDSKVIGNVFGYNVDAIAWEHGQDNLIRGNIFYRDQTALRIWANASQDPNWGYGKKRDTRSRDWRIEGNLFTEIPGGVLNLTRTENFLLGKNGYGAAKGFYEIRGPVKNVRIEDARSSPSRQTSGNATIEQATASRVDIPSLAADGRSSVSFDTHPLADASALGRGATVVGAREFETNWNPLHYHGQPISVGSLLMGRALPPIPKEALTYAPKPLTGGHDPFLKPGTLRGWRYMIVDEWGPYDFKRPLLWPREDLNPGITGRYTRKRFEILGPKGRWTLISKPEGVTLSASQGAVPGTVDVSIPAGQASNVKIEMAYLGAATTDVRGIVTPAGKAVRFGYSKFFAPVDWTIRFYKWTKSENPSEPHSNLSEPELQTIFKGTPLKEVKQDKLDYAGSAFDRVTGNDHFATVAEGEFTIQPGDYTLDLTTDDGARVWLDGKPLIQDAWHYQGPTLYSRAVHLTQGKHTIRVEHFQIDGYAALKVELKPKR